LQADKGTTSARPFEVGATTVLQPVIKIVAQPQRSFLN
jgi:hypothetical protein